MFIDVEVVWNVTPSDVSNDGDIFIFSVQESKDSVRCQRTASFELTLLTLVWKKTFGLHKSRDSTNTNHDNKMCVVADV